MLLQRVHGFHYSSPCAVVLGAGPFSGSRCWSERVDGCPFPIGRVLSSEATPGSPARLAARTTYCVTVADRPKLQVFPCFRVRAWNTFFAFACAGYGLFCSCDSPAWVNLCRGGAALGVRSVSAANGSTCLAVWPFGQGQGCCRQTDKAQRGGPVHNHREPLSSPS